MCPLSASIDNFPRGLVQPQGTFRFSEDALLLAAFALERTGIRREQSSSVHCMPPLWVDLGTGCGVIGLAALLLSRLQSSFTASCEQTTASDKAQFCTLPICYGLDLNEQLIEAAGHNARKLRLEHAFIARYADFSSPEWPQLASDIRNQHGRASLVLANPPWRLEGSGRVPAEESRRRALFGDMKTFPLFIRAAASLLDSTGHFACIVGAARVADMLTALHDLSFNLLRMRFVHPFHAAPAVWVLLEARRTGQTPLQVEAPLILHEPDGTPTAASLEFCPFLR